MVLPLERKEIISNRKYSKKERFALYEQRKSELNVERKGKYLTEIIKELKENGDAPQKSTPCIPLDLLKKVNGFSNIAFPTTLNETKECDEYGEF